MSLPISAGSAPIVGLVLTTVTVCVLVASAFAKLLIRSGDRLRRVERLGYPAGTVAQIAMIELVCITLYLVPPTKMIGAILITGYLGGAVATHVRLADRRFLLPIVLGIFAWAGLYLRDARLTVLLPSVW